MSEFHRLYFDELLFDFPDLVKVQKDSYASFIGGGGAVSSINDIFASVFPVNDGYGRASLEFVSCRIGEPKHDEYGCVERGITYSAPLRAVLRLVVFGGETSGEGDEEGSNEQAIKDVREQEIYMGDIPIMSKNGTFIINGVERVVVSQMHRAPGVFFDNDKARSISGKLNYIARIIPYRGSWLDFEFDAKDILYFRIDKKRKLPITLLLRALGLSNKDIFTRFCEVSECRLSKDGRWTVCFVPEKFKGVRLQYDLINAETGELVLAKGNRISIVLARNLYAKGLRYCYMDLEVMKDMYLADDLVSTKGEVLLPHGTRLTKEHVAKLEFLDVDSIKLVELKGNYIFGTVLQYDCSYEEAMLSIYRVIRPGEIPSIESAEKLFESLFFSPERYDLLNVGRIRLNAKFNLNHDESLTVLTKEDIFCTVKELALLQREVGDVDDIDHLGNRRVRSVGEFMDNQFRIGLVRMAKVIVENMATADFDAVMPCEMINSKILGAVIREFFMSSALSQFMDQTNPLSEITHKRRISALGPGGLNRGRAGFEVRDVHTTHYGRICATETPEGATIGLINSLAIYAKINKYGFIETPYRYVRDGRVTDEVTYLSAIDEIKANICQASVRVDEEGYILDDLVYCRRNYENVFIPRSEVQFADVSAKQIVSVAASLIPFLENDDANRALMGSNMQRQAVPLIVPEAPLVGTGMEGYVARGSGAVIVAKRAGVVQYIDARNIVVASESTDDFWVDSYTLCKFRKSNHNTCIHQRCVVHQGQRVKKGDILADGPAIQQGELALGRNLVVAFLSWRGYNFEDSVVISSNVVRDDLFTSVHLEGFECVVRDTRLGPEEITRDVSGVAEEFLHCLDEFGIACVGANVEAGDVLVGKVTPKSSSPVTPEEKLLRAIFGEKAIDVKDSSLYLPPGVSGCVVDVKVLQRRGIEKVGRALLIEKQAIDAEKARRDHELAVLTNYIYSLLREMLVGKVALNNLAPISKGDVITAEALEKIDRENWWKLSVDGISSIKLLRQRFVDRFDEINKTYEENFEKIRGDDDLAQGVLMVVKVFVAVKHTLQPGDKMSGRHGNKGVISRIVPVEDMPYLADGTPVDIILNPLGVPSRMNVGQILETHLGWAVYNLGKKISKLLDEGNHSEVKSLVLEIYKNDRKMMARLKKMSDAEIVEYSHSLRKGVPVAASVFEGPKTDEIERLLVLAGKDPSGQEVLYDGVTGEQFDRKVTVGCKYMLKLHHLVNDKIHARSIGSYSLITQQPLGGKSHFGGQRFGEMECWALQAYGATFALQEMLTIKSDDVVGRVNVYDSIVRGDNDFYYGVPESFNVMMNELRALCLNVEFCSDLEKKEDFGGLALAASEQ
ncbi:DNA-directed RNA polymerase subunit beta [Neorickettsia sp. 179522]|uniref:DNA-directed RNA polymerase subunit beta n=1 Tax=Neorickettsia sp. 179522 TaxID=1714371 RepID=UPI000798192A|nr:DNA-directed RNA polymerase subunit beta [Neorickettsia sp. 179522]KYH12675.1 DNA-directed RNA polymerase subunit beta [Neorickettsia sp. 179522]